MNRTISVHIGEEGRPVGHLHHNLEGARESASFAYDASWLESPDRFAIDPVLLRLVTGPQFHKRADRESRVFHGAIAAACAQNARSSPRMATWPSASFQAPVISER